VDGGRYTVSPGGRGAGGAGWRARTRLQYPGYDHPRGCARVRHGAPVRNRRAGWSSPVDAYRKLRDTAAPAHFPGKSARSGDGHRGGLAKGRGCYTAQPRQTGASPGAVCRRWRCWTRKRREQMNSSGCGGTTRTDSSSPDRTAGDLVGDGDAGRRRRLSFGGWIWRYDLAPAAGGGTEVRLTYDWSGATPQSREVIAFPPFGVEHLENSLRHLAVLTRVVGNGERSPDRL